VGKLMSGSRQSTLMGVGIDPVTEQQVIEQVLDGVQSGQGGWVCPVNLDVLRQCAQETAVRDLVNSADLVVADGMPLLWASRIAGEALTERVAGSSLIFTLTAAAAQRNASVYFLGGTPGAADGAARVLEDRNPGLRVAGTACPAWGFESDEHQLAALERDLRAANPDIVFLALGFPKQDKLAVRLRTRFPRAWFVSCGISLSFASGQIRRAPRLLQVLGLEWLHRLAQQPRTLFRRYLILGIPFLVELLHSTTRARLSRHR
jgi:N-acetylglucosaminyldiphosphoundecaprenol N-acetyl-beta-D-mannosaminyltransferase